MDSEKYPIHKYIYEWLLDHESITVPELGQFVAEFKGASIHPSIHSISPPNKTIIFNSEPKNDDGELAGFIAEKESLSQIEADDIIRKFVSELKIGLASDQKYELPAFGVFTKNPEGTIEFQADEAINFAGDSFGFPKLFYKPVEKKEDESFFDRDLDTTDEKPFEQKPLTTTGIEEKETPVTPGFAAANDDHVKTPFDDDDDDDLDDDFDDERRRPAWLIPVLGVVAAGLIITLGVFVVPKLIGGSKSEETTKKDTSKTVAANNTDTNTTTSTEVKIDDTSSTGGTSTAENTNNTGSENTTTTDDNNSSNTTSTTNSGGNTSSNTSTTNTGSNTTSTGTTSNTTYRPPANTGNTNSGLFKTLPYRPQTPASGAIVSAPTSRFYIIVASFSTRVNAYSLYNNLKAQGYDAKIIPPVEGSSMHRVASGSYASEDEANRNLRRLTGRLGSEIWVKKY